MDGMKDSPLREKSMDFAVRIMALAKALRDERKEYAVADQVLRSGTAIGANLAEAAFAPTLRDFLNKCKIALKECSETRYWLDLFSRAALFPDVRLAPLRTDCNDLLKMLSSTCKTVESRLRREQSDK